MPIGLQAPPQETRQEDQISGEGETVETNDEDVTLVVDAGDIKPLEPKSLVEAKRCPEWPEWEKVIYEELKTLEEAGTWEISDLPEGANLVGSKWVFHIKKDTTSHVVRYKARLVAQGFSKVEGVDYFDTYTPVAKLSSL
jgi:hypothetical protein